MKADSLLDVLRERKVTIDEGARPRLDPSACGEHTRDEFRESGWRSAFTCPLAKLIQKASLDRTLLAQAQTRVAELVMKYPSDLQVLIADALVRMAWSEEEGKAAVLRVAKRVSELPLETIAPGKAANARQRSVAASQVALWLVARECNKKQSLRNQGKELEMRAIEAARRLANPIPLMAMLLERAALSLDEKDSANAERTLGELTEALQAWDRKTRGGSELAANPPKLPPVSVERFSQIANVAGYAVRHGMQRVALRAFGAVLAGGPPTAGTANNSSRQKLDPVAQQFTLLEPQWSKQGTEAAAVYEALLAVVLPSMRPNEILLFTQPINQNAEMKIQSVGRLLVDWAARCNKLDELRQLVEARLPQPLAEMPACVLLAQIGLAAGNHTLTRDALARLARRLQNDTSESSANLTIHAAYHALLNFGNIDDSGGVARARGQHPRNAETAKSNAVAPVMYITLARFHFQAGRTSDGSKAFARISSWSAVSPRRHGRFGVCNCAGDWLEAWEQLGRYVDSPPPGAFDFREPLGPLPLLASHVGGLSATERFRFLMDWVMPKSRTQEHPHGGRPRTRGPDAALVV